MPSLPVALLLVAAISGVGATQETEGTKRPGLKNGDSIIVKGCLKGPTLEAAEAGPVDGDSLLPTGALTFQLRGKKDVLKDLVAKHDGQQVEVTGVLKSNLRTGTTRGGMIGNTRIVVGADSTTRDRAGIPAPQELLPVLEVKSFEGSALNCRQ